MQFDDGKCSALIILLLFAEIFELTLSEIAFHQEFSSAYVLILE